MHRRHVLVLLAGIAGCSEGSPDPTSTATATPDTTGTPTPTETDAATATATSTEGPTPADEVGGIDAAVRALNDVYAEMEPALESLEVTGLDYGLLADRLGDAEAALASAGQDDATDEERVESLSDTRWIFDRLVRAFTRLVEVYGVHTQLLADYRGSDYTDETASQAGRFRTLATEAANSSGTAVSRFDSLTEFDPALDVEFDAFETGIFRVNDTTQGLTPLALGLEAAIRAREDYVAAVSSYDAGDYRDAQGAFADLLNDFSDARDDFEAADGLAGPLEPHLDDYLCETRVARLACVEYRAACREQLDGDSDAAERRRTQAERRYTECAVGGGGTGSE